MFSPSYYQEQLANAKTPMEEHIALTNLKKANALVHKRKQMRFQAMQEARQAPSSVNTINDTSKIEQPVTDAPKKRGRKAKE